MTTRNRSTGGEADVAAGVASPPTSGSLEMSPATNRKSRSRSASREEMDDSRDFAYSWDEEENGNNNNNDNGRRGLDEVDEEHVGLTSSNRDGGSSTQHRGPLEIRVSSMDSVDGAEPPPPSDDNAMHRFREARPRITRIGSFFFFRSNATSTQSAAYAPSGPSIVGAAIDLSIPTLFNFHLFIEAYNHIDQYGETAAKILPLIFLSVLIVRTVIPPGRRGRFWSVMKFTFMAPFHKVLFRDAFVGDILTSLVRPLQDILFALSYYVTVILGTVSGNLTLSESGDTLESSWLLHNVVLPSCALLPLWWKFLQTLRQSYDSGCRWPHLGNAFKYLSAALVILYGMTHPENRRSPMWIVMFVGCIMYQIWWDVVMDWDLLRIIPREVASTDLGESWFAPRSSFHANSYLLYVRMVIVQPLRDATQWLYRMPRLSQIQLRPRRLYKDQSFYWRILAYNCIFRFCWMLCFIPAYRLSPSGREHVTTFSSDTNSYVGVLLPVVEILRRTFWGFLLLEKETIKMQEVDPSYARLSIMDSNDALEESTDVNEDEDDQSDDSKLRYLPAWLANQPQLQQDQVASRLAALNDMLTLSDDMMHKLFVAELSMWAAAFVGFGLWATA